MWQEVGGGKKYKNRTRNWEIFSWNKPTGGKGAFTCNSGKSTLAFRSLLDIKCVEYFDQQLGALCVVYFDQQKCQR